MFSHHSARSSSRGRYSTIGRRGADRRIDLSLATDLHAEEVAIDHADDGERVRVEHQRLADRAPGAAKFTLPEAPREHGDGRTATDVIFTGDRAPKNGRHAEGAEVVAAHPLAVDRAHFAALGEVETTLAVGKGAGVQFGMTAQLLPRWDW